MTASSESSGHSNTRTRPVRTLVAEMKSLMQSQPCERPKSTCSAGSVERVERIAAADPAAGDEDLRNRAMSSRALDHVPVAFRRGIDFDLPVDHPLAPEKEFRARSTDTKQSYRAVDFPMSVRTRAGTGRVAPTPYPSIPGRVTGAGLSGCGPIALIAYRRWSGVTPRRCGASHAPGARDDGRNGDGDHEKD